MRYAFAALVLAACNTSGTGALLTLTGSGTIDELDVTAHLASGDVTRTATVKDALPTTYLAILPAVSETVAFDVVARSGGALVGSGSGTGAITPRHVTDVTIPLNGPAGGDLSTSVDAGAFMVTHGGTGTLTSVWASGDDVWITADAPTDNLLHAADGHTFTAMTVGTTPLRAVFGASGTIFVVGDGGAIYSGTTTFTRETSPVGARDLTALWGTSATDLYAVGAQSTILHRVMGGWVEQGAVGATTFRAVWGSAGRVYVAGDGGMIVSSPGNGVWSPVTSGTTQVFRALSGTSANDVWAAGDGGTLLHSTGGPFSATASGTEQALYALTPTIAAGASWTVLEGGATVATGLGGTGTFFGAFAADHLWLVGSGGTILER